MNKFEGASIARRIGQSLVFKIPVNFKTSEMFIEMHSVEKELGITNIAITESSLQDVFIAVVVKYDKIEDDEQTGEPKLVQYIRQSDEEEEIPQQMKEIPK